VTHIDKTYTVTKWTLRQIVKFALNGSQGLDREQAKLITKLMDKLKYCKEVLTSIQAASGKGKDGLDAGEDYDVGPEPHFQAELLRRGSKASLR
jgi:polo-like kinase 1